MRYFILILDGTSCFKFVFPLCFLIQWIHHQTVGAVRGFNSMTTAFFHNPLYRHQFFGLGAHVRNAQ